MDSISVHLWGEVSQVKYIVRCRDCKKLAPEYEKLVTSFKKAKSVLIGKVECPKYPGFCITRQRKDYPFIESFHSPEHAANQGRIADPNITKYSVKVLPFNYDVSAYGFREFFKKQGLQATYPK
ncbi:Thioredoxin superfamily protein [Thalictrum thalictroides]|uniref:Thioredoxin superfamily protein n=1 Tax=Thalictrum thalictroides TaxID=46969 RepID=A0A7J6W300_THATH|nr:Thioredoxin superfamily protein [Thalictrum thalictroides]